MTKKLMLIGLLCLVAQVAIAEETKEEVIEENDAWKLERIDSATFYAAKKRVNPKPQQKARKITDVEEIKKLLAPRGFKFVTDKWESEEGEMREATYMYYPIKGKFYKEFAAQYDPGMHYHPESLRYEEDGYHRLGDEHLGLAIGTWEEGYNSAYYPDEDVFVETTDFDNPYNFRTGKMTSNPDYWVYSPSKRYRLNAYDGGLVSDGYWYLEKQSAPGQYRQIGENFPFPLTTLKRYFWDGDRVLYLINDWLMIRAYEYSKTNKDQYWRVTIKNDAK